MDDKKKSGGKIHAAQRADVIKLSQAKPDKQHNVQDSKQ
jgi:hypothetical protein